MKNYLILSYEGDVLIRNIPNKISRENIIDFARIIIQRKKGNSITGLNNVEVFINSRIYDLFEKHEGVEKNVIDVYWE